MKYPDIYYIDYLFHLYLGNEFRYAVIFLYGVIMLLILGLVTFMLKDSKIMIIEI